MHYAKLIEKITFPIGISIMNTLNIESAKNILECGCGSGITSIELLRRKSQESSLYLSDFSNKMLSLSKYRFTSFLKNPES